MKWHKLWRSIADQVTEQGHLGPGGNKEIPDWTSPRQGTCLLSSCLNVFKSFKF